MLTLVHDFPQAAKSLAMPPKHQVVSYKDILPASEIAEVEALAAPREVKDAILGDYVEIHKESERRVQTKFDQHLRDKFGLGLGSR